ncbi:phosphodiester glycosidase family protein [Pedobacter aquatilis]|uniref:phosphodiester glycosidase family protein n=1 Tax=Pedobacter aquatilis TaxID=351343 RepID=UPI0025B33ED0|nr:phosphodiester glycosidase family protein [Pedobacter aquatilis]MDN3586597.1 phosphodiester glycosidase family protein [Pedobacter aquatilis]
MFKKLTSLILLCASGLLVNAQNTDSLTIVKTKWQKTRLTKQVKLFTHHFNTGNLFSANQNISFVEVKNSGKKTVFAIGAEAKTLINTSDFALRDTAIAAINGNFFDVKNGGSVDFVKLNGKTINTNRLEKDNARARHQQAAVVINNGKISINKWDGTTDWETKLTENNVMLNGPLLTFDGIDELLDSAAFNRLRHPRTCIGIKPNGKIILLTVDGRHENAAGLSLFELTKVMKWLGCKTAINFDGGGSTTLWTQKNGVINYPSDNKKWDHDGQRKVANVILVKKK